MRERGKEVRVKQIINEKSFMSRYLVVLEGLRYPHYIGLYLEHQTATLGCNITIMQ